MDKMRYLLDVNADDDLALTSDYELTDPRYEPLTGLHLEPLGVFGRELRQCHYTAHARREFPDGVQPPGWKPAFTPDKWAKGKWWGNC